MVKVRATESWPKVSTVGYFTILDREVFRKVTSISGRSICLPLLSILESSLGCGPCLCEAYQKALCQSHCWISPFLEVLGNTLIWFLLLLPFLFPLWPTPSAKWSKYWGEPQIGLWCAWIPSLHSTEPPLMWKKDKCSGPRDSWTATFVWGQEAGHKEQGRNQGKWERVCLSRSSRWQGGGILHFCIVGQSMPDLGRMQPQEGRELAWCVDLALRPSSEWYNSIYQETKREARRSCVLSEQIFMSADKLKLP